MAIPSMKRPVVHSQRQKEKQAGAIGGELEDAGRRHRQAGLREGVEGGRDNRGGIARDVQVALVIHANRADLLGAGAPEVGGELHDRVDDERAGAVIAGQGDLDEVSARDAVVACDFDAILEDARTLLAEFAPSGGENQVAIARFQAVDSVEGDVDAGRIGPGVDVEIIFDIAGIGAIDHVDAGVDVAVADTGEVGDAGEPTAGIAAHIVVGVAFQRLFALGSGAGACAFEAHFHELDGGGSLPCEGDARGSEEHGGSGAVAHYPLNGLAHLAGVGFEGGMGGL